MPKTLKRNPAVADLPPVLVHQEVALHWSWWPYRDETGVELGARAQLLTDPGR